MAIVREGNKGVLVVAMTWLSYPGRTTSTATAEEAGFVAAGRAAPA
jgi:hypothetical protein